MATYEGPAYIRPLNRGLCLGEDMEDFEDWLQRVLGVERQGWYGLDIDVRITVELLSHPAGEQREGQGDE